MPEERKAKPEDKHLCKDCKDDYYNGNNSVGIKECWSFDNAEVVTRFRIPWWTPMDRAENFTKVTTLSCHMETGHFLFCKGLPDHLEKDIDKVREE